ncbi:MAG: hypothetical protein HY749_00340 [Gammaproteobacteria bacterium]|nr:hypothetical protein [Gammaproteobacteria bacterium]
MSLLRSAFPAGITAQCHDGPVNCRAGRRHAIRFIEMSQARRKLRATDRGTNMLRIELIKCGSREFVEYTGTRDDLLASGVAEPRMFPCVGYVRLYPAEARRWNSAGYFHTTRRGELFVIRRWRHWQLAPAQQARLRALVASLSPGSGDGRPLARVISLAEERRRREA